MNYIWPGLHCKQYLELFGLLARRQFAPNPPACYSNDVCPVMCLPVARLASSSASTHALEKQQKKKLRKYFRKQNKKAKQQKKQCAFGYPRIAPSNEEIIIILQLSMIIGLAEKCRARRILALCWPFVQACSFFSVAKRESKRERTSYGSLTERQGTPVQALLPHT